MAGSKKYLVYTTDDGTDFALLSDESNIEAVNAGTQDYVNGLTIKYCLPSNVQPRQAVFRSLDGRRTIKCTVLTRTIYDGLAGGAITSIPDPFTQDAVLYLSQLIPEVLTLLPKAVDTGLNDGDNS